MKFSSAFILPFLALSLVSISASARMIDRTAALVNADVVLESDLSDFKKNFTLRRELDPFIALTSFQPKSQQDILDYLVQEQLALQKETVSDDEVEEEISGVQRNNHIDRDQLLNVLKGQGVDFSVYKRLMRVAVAKRKLVDRELRPLAAVSDEEVKNFYYTDASTLAQREKQKLLLAYTMQQLIVPNQKLSEVASKRIKAGEDLDAVAAELSSQGVESSKVAALSEENMNSQIREAIKGLKVGESTRPISTGGGYMILKITEISAPTDPVFEKSKEQIRGMLFQKSLVNQLHLWTERERATSYVNFTAKEKSDSAAAKTDKSA